MKYINKISKINRWDAENVFYLKSDHKRISKFITHYEIFKKILDVPGDIIECGVFFGGGLMTSAHLSSIFEPINFERRIIGFDTFTGLTELGEFDSTKSTLAKKGAYALLMGMDSIPLPSVDSLPKKSASSLMRLTEENRKVNSSKFSHRKCSR